MRNLLAIILVGLSSSIALAQTGDFKIGEMVARINGFGFPNDYQVTQITDNDLELEMFYAEKPIGVSYRKQKNKTYHLAQEMNGIAVGNRVVVVTESGPVDHYRVVSILNIPGYHFMKLAYEKKGVTLYSHWTNVDVWKVSKSKKQ
jgi:hypothetical protein